MPLRSSISSIAIEGYRPFGKFRADVGQLEVIVGVNGSGKSSLFEFLNVLHKGMEGELPAGLVAGAATRRIYHDGFDSISWDIDFRVGDGFNFFYAGTFDGPYGQHVQTECLGERGKGDPDVIALFVENGVGYANDSLDPVSEHKVSLLRANKLALGTIWDRALMRQMQFQEIIRNWHFYSSFNIAADKVRQPVITQQAPVLAEDASNLSDVLQHLKNEHDDAFEEVKGIMRLCVPGFKNIKVKSYGAPGQIMAFWEEDGVDGELSLADLSDGIFRLLCWTVLCVMPNPPSLICIDEPDQGVHPRTLPVLAGLFKKASLRTQIFLATHNSYFLSEFDIDDIAVMRKENGEAKFIKPKDSKVLTEMLKDFGSSEIEALHRSEELERIP